MDVFQAIALRMRCTEKWWTKKQELWSGEVVFFSWQDYPKWPGIIVPPCSKSALLQGKGMFYPPDAKVLDTAFKCMYFWFV